MKNLSKLLVVLFITLFMTSCACEFFNSCDDDYIEMSLPCIEFGGEGCLNYGIPEPNYVPSGEETVYFYDCDVDSTGFLPFCDFIDPIEQGEIYGVKRSPNGTILYYNNDYQGE